MKTNTKALPSSVLEQKYRVAILTKCCDDWGGSEELWARSLPFLQQAGVEAMLLKEYINMAHPRIAELARDGVLLCPLRKASLVDRVIKKVANNFKSPGADWAYINFKRQLQQYRPHLIIIAQGINFDGLDFAAICLELRIPYVVICQKAVEFYWPPAHLRQSMQRTFEGAKKCFFVSHHNQRLTEEQFGFRFSNACVIHNPVRFIPVAIPFPENDQPLRLACVGRLFVIDKGQDILLRILAQEKWRSRPLEISFVGTGVDEEGLRALSRLLEVRNVTFTGHVNDMEQVWKDHHALVLPSRSEGAPLVVLEALAVGRPVIASKAGGTPEYVQEGINGFLADATQSDFEAAMERAWQQRHLWRQMGNNAVSMIQRMVPGCPEQDFANAITQILYEN